MSVQHKPRLHYTPNYATEYTVWHDRTRKIGFVAKFGFRWLAISLDHRNLGSFASMSEAGNRILEEEEKNGTSTS